MASEGPEMTNATAVKFGYPETLLVEGEHWAILLRPAQVTLGALILVNKGEETRYGDLPAGAFAEQGRIVAAIEQVLQKFSRYEKINYLMLMMVDPHVHFHIIPRYAGARGWDHVQFSDSGWPGLPDLKSGIDLDPELRESIAGHLRKELQALLHMD